MYSRNPDAIVITDPKENEIPSEAPFGMNRVFSDFNNSLGACIAVRERITTASTDNFSKRM